jgi:hypothetical protein
MGGGDKKRQDAATTEHNGGRRGVGGDDAACRKRPIKRLQLVSAAPRSPPANRLLQQYHVAGPRTIPDVHLGGFLRWRVVPIGRSWCVGWLGRELGVADMLEVPGRAEARGAGRGESSSAIQHQAAHNLKGA